MNSHPYFAEILLAIVLPVTGVGVFAWWCQLMVIPFVTNKRAVSVPRQASEEPEVKEAQRAAELALTNSLLREEIVRRKRTEIALREATERYRIASELTSDYAYTFKVEADDTQVCEWITGAFTHITGFTVTEVEERGGWYSLVHPRDRAIVQRQTQTLLSGRKNVSEFRVVTKDKEVRWLRAHGYPIWDEAQGRVVRIYGAAQDITGHKQMEQQLIQSERLAALGRLAATLAHEFNNPLQIMRSYLDLIFDFPLELDEKERYLHIIGCQIDHLRDVSRNMLHYAGSHPVQQQPVSVTELIEQVLVLTSKELQKRDVQVTTDMQDAPPVMAIPEQLVQVFLNLVINAIESTSGSNGLLEIALRSENGRIIASFTNNGPVIPSTVLPHILKPFYTTKSEGNGLGLWISHNLVRKHKGTLRVENLGAERGVRFTVTLPAIAPREPKP